MPFCPWKWSREWVWVKSKILSYMMGGCQRFFYALKFYCEQPGILSSEKTYQESLVWMIWFDNFADWEQTQWNIGLIVSCFPFFLPYWIDILAPKWRQLLLSDGVLARQFKYHSWRQKAQFWRILKSCISVVILHKYAKKSFAS